MKKIKSTKAFKDAVDVAFDTQTKRDKRKREYDDLNRDFDERRDADDEARRRRIGERYGPPGLSLPPGVRAVLPVGVSGCYSGE